MTTTVNVQIWLHVISWHNPCWRVGEHEHRLAHRCSSRENFPHIPEVQSQIYGGIRGLNGCGSNGKVSYGSLGDMLKKGEYPFQASHDYSLGKIMENTYMLHVVCTGYCLWLFSVIAAPKLSRYLKSTWATAPSKLVLFLFIFALEALWRNYGQ